MTKSDNEDRKQRILDAAANLFVHYGYDKTTVSDIAREAGVSKGAIYLHFTSKEDLFEGLLIREMMTYAQIWHKRLQADPKGGTIAGLYKNSLYAMSDSTFMMAMFKRDKRVFGTYLRKPGNFFQQFRGQQPSGRFVFVKMMQEAGAIRQDISAKVIAHIMDILAYGLVGMDEIIDPDQIPPIEEIIEGIAELMDTALTPAGGGNTEIGKTIIQQLFDAGQQQYQDLQENRTNQDDNS